jgi:hypothetical protein
LVSNYCRNSDNEPSIWCYTTDPKVRWETCVPIEGAAEVAKAVYDIKIDRLITGTSVSSITVAKLSTKSDIKIELPDKVQLSGPPLSGKYKIKCVYPNG